MLFSILFIYSITVCYGKELEVVTENWPPFIISDAEGAELRTSGTVTHIVKDILAYTNINYRIRVYPWSRSFHYASTKPNHLIYSIYKTDERFKMFHWFCPIFKSTPIHAYKLATNKIDINSFSALRKAVIGTMRGDNSHDNFLSQGFVEGVNLDVSSDEETNLRKFIKGRVDVITQSEESLRYRLNRLGHKNLEIIKGMKLHKGESTEHCMALSLKTSPEIVEKISGAFSQWQKHESLTKSDFK